MDRAESKFKGWTAEVVDRERPLHQRAKTRRNGHVARLTRSEPCPAIRPSGMQFEMLEADNVALRHKVVDLALEIQALRDRLPSLR
jgi:hypothetical protein